MADHKKHDVALDKICFCGEPSAIDKSVKYKPGRYYGLCPAHLAASLEAIEQASCGYPDPE